MASKCNVSIGLFLANNILLFVIVSGCETSTIPIPNNNYNPTSNPYPNPTPTTVPATTPSTNANPNQNPSSNLNPTSATCPRDTLKLGVCANLLGGLVSVELGSPPVKPCCSLIQGLVDLEAAVCLCTAIKANLLGINLDVPLSLSLLLNACGNQVPNGFQCA